MNNKEVSNLKTLKFKEEELYLEVGQYMNGRIAVIAYTEEDMYGDITKNLPFAYLENENGGFINQFTKSDGLEDRLIKEGIIEKVVDTIQYNMGKYDKVIFNLEKLREYDKDGIDKYLKSKEEEEEYE